MHIRCTAEPRSAPNRMSNCLEAQRFVNVCAGTGRVDQVDWHVCYPQRNVCQPWLPRLQCLGSGRGGLSRFRTMQQCSKDCPSASGGFLVHVH